MNCQFCQNPLKFSHYENSKEVEAYECNRCPVMIFFYVFHKDGSPFKTTFMLDKNEKTYMWTNHYIKENSYITFVGDRNSLEPLIKFPKIMNLTPTNVREKFNFYMVFL